MISLTRIAGQPFVLNCDLIERVDSTPDTVISLVDGKKYVVAESLDDVVAAVRLFRSEVIALSNHLRPESLLPVPEPHEHAHLTAVAPIVSEER
ncbi:flagellar protein FlbD [Nocardioides mangrovicus]|uniref:Flagellar protein FlbD n=1 Tax=Nocardioides mangrovicus TaxID=2478913 RepID=A0A3L8P2V6_9ACTN|nr:flagellar FlbD family protein [Nocardioides mangrovicus]RLV49381.1 flagellar protein FlbD [Nocardioides mangrovicus]